MGDETVVKDTLLRLQREGLDRHEAVHAVGSVFIKQMWEGLKGLKPKGNLGQIYEEAFLPHLTAESWRRSAREI